MAARATGSGTISFGLVSIPVKLFTAASSEQVRFNMLHTKCGGRLKMQYYCPTDDEVVDRTDTMKGYEYGRGQYVKFEDEELKKLEAERSNSIDIVEFVPLEQFDLVQVEKSYYLGPDKGGDKAYRLLSESMRSTNRVAVGRWAARGKEQLVLIRPYKDGLIFHQLFYGNEVRAFDDVDTGAKIDFSATERDLAEKLIAQLSSDEFDVEKYHDSYNERVLAAVEQKVQGEKITMAPEAPKAQIIDLFEALKKSLSEGKGVAKAGDGAASSEPAAGGEGSRKKKVQKEPLKPPAKASSDKASTKRSRAKRSSSG